MNGRKEERKKLPSIVRRCVGRSSRSAIHLNYSLNFCAPFQYRIERLDIDGHHFTFRFTFINFFSLDFVCNMRGCYRVQNAFFLTALICFCVSNSFMHRRYVRTVFSWLTVCKWEWRNSHFWIKYFALYVFHVVISAWIVCVRFLLSKWLICQFLSVFGNWDTNSKLAENNDINATENQTSKMLF